MMMSKFLVVLAVSVLLLEHKSDAFLSRSIAVRRQASRSLVAVADLADPSLLHGALDAFHAHGSQLLHSTLSLADEAVANVEQAVSPYSKVDKTGFIGFFATYIEIAIDAAHSALQSVGVKNSYGFSIALFTVLIKLLTLPLTTTQLESTTRMQKLTPLSQKIQAKYASDEQTKNQLMAQLFQAAQVNPLAGCFPALVQIPVFISLYRALQNLVAANKLNEPFLWIPDLEGPVYSSPPGESLDWFKTAFSGNPLLGWEDTIAFGTLPLILYVSQTISTKILQPAKDPNKVLTEQEQFSQGLINNLPFVVAFFSLNVPAGLAVYWIINNILTTGITLMVKNNIKDEALPAEVAQMMAAIDSGDLSGGAAKTRGPSSAQELRRPTLIEDEKKVQGFGSTLKAIDVAGEVIGAGATSTVGEASAVATTTEGESEEVGGDDDEKRKKRSKKDKKKRG